MSLSVEVAKTMTVKILSLQIPERIIAIKNFVLRHAARKSEPINANPIYPAYPEYLTANPEHLILNLVKIII
jgi:hypothetical protein